MTFQTHFEDLFRYNDWANRRVIDMVRRLHDHADEATVGRALDLLSHVIRAQIIWLDRVQGRTDTESVWGRDSLEACTTRSTQSTAAWLAHLPDQDPEANLTYRNTRGREFTQAFRQIATHVVNHGTHHRGQIVALVRASGLEPVPTDYIAYARA